MNLRSMFFIAVLLLLCACNYITYTPRSNKTIRRQTPSVVFCERVVEFRLDQQRWPVSKEDFVSKSVRYKEVFETLPYNATNFKMIDSNRMTFYFSAHIIDREKYDKTNQFELNSLNGRIKFYKENDRFIYKIKMN